MKITDALLGEHGVLYDEFDRLEAVLDRRPDLATTIALAAVLDAALEPHASMEDDLLFDRLESLEDADQGPLTLMREEHQQIAELLRRIDGARDAAAARALLADVLALARDHFGREERVAFPMAERLIPGGELARLGEQWARRRNVVLE